jgi:hypothetical protein
MAYLSDRMRSLAASGCPQAAELLEKADDLDEALAKDTAELLIAIPKVTKLRTLADVRESPSHLHHDGRLRGHRFKTARLGLSLGAIRALGEGQESESASRQARGRGGLGTSVVATEISSLPGAVLVRASLISSRRALFLELRRAR